MNNATRGRHASTKLYWCLLCCLVLAACGGSGGGGSTTVVPPDSDPTAGATGFVYQPPADIGDGWETGDLGRGARAMAVEGLMDAIADGDFSDLDSIAIAHRGQLVFNHTLRGELDVFDREVGNDQLAVHAQFSVSKSLASVLVGVAVAQGFISSEEVPYLELFPYSSYGNWDERKADISLQDVLTMRSGLDWNEWDPPYEHPDNQLFRFHENHHDYSKSFLDLPLSHTPGERFAYNTIASTSLGQAIENATSISLVDFANSYLVDALQLQTVAALETPTGLPDLGRGLFLSTRDVAKFGQLMLNGGSWAGRPIVSEDWVQASTRAYFELYWTDPEQWDWQVDGYGYQWWIGHFEVEGERFDTFSADGHGGQLLVGVPGLELVVAVNARAYGLPAADPNQMFRLIRRHILPAFSD